MFRERIKDVYDDLSAGYRIVADFLLDHPFDAAFMTASNIAKRLKVDTATVVRFAQRLGYEGYPELLEDVRVIVREEIQRRLTSAEEAPGDAGTFRRNIEMEHRNLDQLSADLDDKIIEDVVATISNARQIVVVGQWAMEPLGAFFAMWLKALGKPAQAINADIMSAGFTLRDMGDKDVVIAFTLSGLGAEMVNTLKAAKASGVRVVVFSNNRSQAAARLADINIPCPGESVGPLTSFASTFTAIAAILTVIISHNSEAYKAHTASFDKMYHNLVEGYKLAAAGNVAGALGSSE